MTHSNSPERLRRVASGALLFSAFALLSACSSDDKRPLLLVNVPLGTFAASAQTLQVTVAVDGVQVAQQTLGASMNAQGNYGFYLPSGTSGSATVSVWVFNSAACQIAIGAGGPVPVTPGNTSGPVVITLGDSGVSCSTDAGAPDTLPPPADVGGSLEAAGADAAAGVEIGSISPVDAPGTDGPVADGPLAETGPDLLALPDVAADGPAPDAPLATEVGPEVALDLSPGLDLAVADAEVGPTTLSVFRNCTEYTHTVTFSDGTIGNWAVLKVVYSPDGKYLISFGEDGRAKVWEVASTGLTPQSGGLLFTGQDELTGAIRSDGKYLAVGERYGQVTLYDFPGSLAAGGAVTKWTLPATGFSPTPWRAARLQFTSDGDHLVVAYSADSSPDSNLLVVWDLTTQTIVRTVAYVYDDWPYSILPGTYSAPMWVASAATGYGDAGSETTVTVMDVAQSSPTKAQTIVTGTVDSMAFSPDGNTLAVGLASGEVSLLDVTDKTKIVPKGSPLIGGTSAGYTDVYALAFTSDGSYLAAAADNSSSPSAKLVSLAQKLTVQKITKYTPVSLAFAPGNLALAAGEMFKGALLYCTP